MRILRVDRPDEGTVILDDRRVRLEGPADAFARGVGMVHQEFMLAAPLTLLENLILAREPVVGVGLIDGAKLRPTGARRGDRRRPDRLASQGRRRADSPAPDPGDPPAALSRRRRLIFDEPTAVLAPPQVATCSP